MYNKIFNQSSLLVRSANTSCCVLFKTTSQKCSASLIRNLSTSSVHHKMRSKWIAPTLRELKNRNERMALKNQLPVERRSTYIEWNHDAELYALGQRLGEKFDEKLLLTAIIDPSHLHYLSNLQEQHGLDSVLNRENKNRYNFTVEQESNEQLAKEGAVLIQNSCHNFVQKCWPHVPEEGILSVREFLTNDNTLNEVSQSLGIKDIIFAEPYPPSAEVRANAVRAIVAALYKSSGKERTDKFITDFIAIHMCGKSLWDMWKVSDPISILSCIMSKSEAGEIEYRLINRAGENTLESVYRIGVYVNKKFIATGYGETTDVASSVAALNALAKIFGATDSKPTLPFEFNLPPSYSKFPHPYENSTKSAVKLEDYTLQNSHNVVYC